MARTELPLSALVTERCTELDLSRSKLVARCGYKNISKGIRRLEQVVRISWERPTGLRKYCSSELRAARSDG
jgi:hypothetical protein